MNPDFRNGRRPVHSRAPNARTESYPEEQAQASTDTPRGPDDLWVSSAVLSQDEGRHPRLWGAWADEVLFMLTEGGES